MKFKLEAVILSFKEIFSVSPFSTAFSVLWQITNGILPAGIIVVTANLLDAISNKDLNLCVMNAAAFIILYMLKYIMEFIYSLTLNIGIYEKATASFRRKFCKKLSNLEFICHEDSNILDMKKRAYDVVEKETVSSIFNMLTTLISSVTSIVSVSVVLCKYDFYLFVLSIISVTPYFVIIHMRGQEFYKIQWAQTKNKRFMDYLWGLFANKSSKKEMKTLKFENYIADIWSSTGSQVNREIFEQDKKEVRSVLFCDVVKIIGYALSIILTALLVRRGSISIGVFGACLTAFLSLQEMMQNFLTKTASLPRRCSEVSDYIKFMKLPEEKYGDAALKSLTKGISIQNISFGYPNGDELAVKNVSFDIKQGETLAIVGENGSGKTTLARLILGLYHPCKGDIFYDDIPITSMSREGFKSAMLSQNFVKYKLTFQENIALTGNANKSRISQLLRYSEFEALNQENLETQLGKEFGGIELSQGQWQRLAIMRALYPESDLTVLDEPTAAIDPIAEADILNCFIEAVEEKTAIIITHRVGICRRADKIVVMDHGNVVEIGSHEELMHKKGKYYDMYCAQSKWYR